MQVEGGQGGSTEINPSIPQAFPTSPTPCGMGKHRGVVGLWEVKSAPLRGQYSGLPSAGDLWASAYSSVKRGDATRLSLISDTSPALSSCGSVRSVGFLEERGRGLPFNGGQDWTGQEDPPNDRWVPTQAVFFEHWPL